MANWSLVVSVCSIAIGLMAASFGWFFQKAVGLAFSRVEKLEEKLSRLEIDLKDYQINMAGKFVAREEWLREASSVDASLSKLQEKIYGRSP